MADSSQWHKSVSHGYFFRKTKKKKNWKSSEHYNGILLIAMVSQEKDSQQSHSLKSEWVKMKLVNGKPTHQYYHTGHTKCFLKNHENRSTKHNEKQYEGDLKMQII